MAKSLIPQLMFQDHDAEAAMTLYVSLFADSRIEEITRYGAQGPGKEGSVVRARFTVAGQALACIDSPAKHAFGFTPSMSLFVECQDAEELERAWAALIEGGTAMMPLDNYGFSQRFGWLADRFGVSWQLNLA
ncbi:Glyoxalase superfamily enzyme, possibly 3-demethylubiquinone-9 3-methyltransferase [Pseudoxanthomonas sp. GM95]|uniref:VOC family protein n=1 Tax=Pseudoxanthomonas sp. GM95 TaxID=1881043 RepID=UPI0008AF86A2|nr:VOC family protein [Pseudoxanthomonas sp. GM95]SEM23559.1 Glyoxalase superfamily enzyme, possibly 3-demethylubiquinone-9 3-methyltransferase [Pseudoxanthomonas sp. GM95]